ncbi:hypothetical protein T11_7259 [Trichinella zimbabwensis]|uniref:Uncharacterized protein n=1 Tax=Trichinella zimbabwensis TaxID=268475 RepID=A0A0V1G6Z5_9BILA|nr:hypothetical protein T11_7259 [Trichinella zimbabwensis]
MSFFALFRVNQARFGVNQAQFVGSQGDYRKNYMKCCLSHFSW